MAEASARFSMRCRHFLQMGHMTKVTPTTNRQNGSSHFLRATKAAAELSTMKGPATRASRPFRSGAPLMAASQFRTNDKAPAPRKHAKEKIVSLTQFTVGHSCRDWR